MTTTLEMIEQTRTELLGSQQEQLNQLAANITATETQVSLTYSTDGLQRGMHVSIGLEDMYVWDYTAQTLTVQRAARGTGSATHTAGDLVYVQPRYSNATILKALNADLRDLSSPSCGLYRVKTLDLVTTVAQTSYDLSGVNDIIDPIQLNIDIPGSDNTQPYVRQWDLQRNQEEGTFSSGLALRLYETVPNGRPLRFIYKAPFGELTSLTQDVANVSGLQQTAHDIPPLGAEARLVGVSEARRAQLQGQPDTRRAAEVPPGSAARGASVLMQMRARRIASERSRLQQRYPEHKWA